MNRKAVNREHQQFDVAIIGSGLAGGTLALQLIQENISSRIVVFDRIGSPLPEGCHTVGESTVEVGAEYLAKVLGLEKHLQEEHLIKFGTRFFFGGGDKPIEERMELGGSIYAPTESYQIDRGRLENLLRKKLLDMGVTFYAPAKVKEVELLSPKEHIVTYQSTAQNEQSIHARWVIDASGRSGFLKRRLQLNKSVSHNISSSWFRVQGHIDISDWCTNEHWKSWENGHCKRLLSTNHLMGKGYWVWLIPLPGDFMSIGIVVDADQISPSEISSLENSLAWLEAHEPQCAAHIEQESIIDFSFLKNLSYSSERVMSSERWCLTGEAGVFLDPFYSPGTDFIGISNMLISDLIKRDLSGECIRQRSLYYNHLFLQLYEHTFPIYKGMYKFFDNPTVMPLKIVWDFALYWGFIGTFFFEGKFTDMELINQQLEALARVRILNQKMQSFFCTWANTGPVTPKRTFLDLFQIDYLIGLNRNLSESYEQSFEERFERKVTSLEVLAKEIVEFSGIPVDLIEYLEKTDSGEMLEPFLNDFCGGMHV